MLASANRLEEDVLQQVVGKGWVVYLSEQESVELLLVRGPRIEDAAEGRHAHVTHVFGSL